MINQFYMDSHCQDSETYKDTQTVSAGRDNTVSKRAVMNEINTITMESEIYWSNQFNEKWDIIGTKNCF